MPSLLRRARARLISGSVDRGRPILSGFPQPSAGVNARHGIEVRVGGLSYGLHHAAAALADPRWSWSSRR